MLRAGLAAVRAGMEKHRNQHSERPRSWRPCKLPGIAFRRRGCARSS